MTSIPAARLEEMIEQATVDCDNDSEQACGFFTLLDEALAVPFETSILGIAVTVTALDLTVDDQIVAVCTRAGASQRIPVLDLPRATGVAGGAIGWDMSHPTPSAVGDLGRRVADQRVVRPRSKPGSSLGTGRSS
jgi:hypothetical protein